MKTLKLVICQYKNHCKIKHAFLKVYQHFHGRPRNYHTIDHRENSYTFIPTANVIDP